MHTGGYLIKSLVKSWFHFATVNAVDVTQNIKSNHFIVSGVDYYIVQIPGY